MNILFVPRTGAGDGTGHLKRVLMLGKHLNTSKKVSPYLYIKDTDTVKRLEAWGGAESFTVISGMDRSSRFDFILVDHRETDREFYHELAERGGPVIGIDEGGDSRALMPFLIDTMPSLSPLPPNIFLPHTPFEPRPARIKKKITFPSVKILVTFGGEDSAGLTGKILALIMDHDIFDPEEITIVQGPGFKQVKWPEGLKVIRDCTDVSSLLPDYDLVLTHFGLTCFEALFYRVPLILFNPTPYHRRLSRKAGFPEIGVLRPSLARFKKILADKNILSGSIERYDRLYRDNKSLYEFVSVFLDAGAPVPSAQCPVCRVGSSEVTARFPGKTYFRCRACGITFLFPLGLKPVRYEKDYFFSEYKKQYGKTYLDDFENIKAVSMQRTGIIENLVKNPAGKRLLDIGCAYGPFLSAAVSRGFDALGLDISKTAVDYINKELKIRAYVIDFEEFTDEGSPLFKGVSVVTMWYVIEHFKLLERVLKTVSTLVPPSGIFAFATPYGKGISARRNKRSFLEQSPSDHYTIWNKKNCRRILGKYGFKVEHFRVTGHHPERFPFIKPEKPVHPFFYALFLNISRFFQLGDTFEVYARKTGDGTP
ncbi:MAG: methyltransferase domain-containing protein [Spirochaetales bacterium]|nr:methyltransferase domain-containing protein [Spirochaetales bacterium]